MAHSTIAPQLLPHFIFLYSNPIFDFGIFPHSISPSNIQTFTSSVPSSIPPLHTAAPAPATPQTRTATPTSPTSPLRSQFLTILPSLFHRPHLSRQISSSIKFHQLH
ncbi:hypothetical protein LguiB_004368 [Lonicera macranthoides]